MRKKIVRRVKTNKRNKLRSRRMKLHRLATATNSTKTLNQRLKMNQSMVKCSLQMTKRKRSKMVLLNRKKRKIPA